MPDRIENVLITFTVVIEAKRRKGEEYEEKFEKAMDRLLGDMEDQAKSEGCHINNSSWEEEK